MFLYFCTVAAIVALTIVCTVFASDSATERSCEKFLYDFGIEIQGECIEKEKLTIPTIFDDVYKTYNDIQLQAGLDLSPYKGKQAVRFTYIISNYPNNQNNEVKANVICVDGVPVGGDVMTTSINGFMKPLNCLTSTNSTTLQPQSKSEK